MGNSASAGGIVDQSRVYVKADAYGGAGAWARIPIKKGELVEEGIVRVLPVDGNESPYVFTWSETEPRKWASGSGASVFYNMSDTPNTHMTRDFENNSFKIHATRDIAKDEELSHVYISATWRKCFKDMKPMAERYLAKQKELQEKGESPEEEDTLSSEEKWYTKFLPCCTVRDRREDEPGDFPGVVDMSKVIVKPDVWGGAGAFARVPIKKGDLVEKGIVRVLPVDGNDSPFVFTWSEKDPRKWASGSGASVFYNMSEDPNTHMTRNFKGNSFEIHAERDIAAGEELTHVYISATWRKCFADLKPMAERYLEQQKVQKGP